MASTFKEKFRVTMINSEGSSERVTIQLSLDGLKIMNQDGSRTMRSYNLRNVSRWDLMDTSTVIWTKTDVDLEERPLTLSSDPTTIRNVVDTLASCCMQLAEFIKDKESDHQAASNLEELAAGGGKTRKAAKLPSVDSVEYWRSPDKAGWLQSQSEVMKMWRRRWFVLKQGYLFRFLSPDVSESVKPRGVVDLSKVQDVRDGRSVTGKANTVQLKTASGGSVCYVCESETEMVEWISALEGAIAKIVKQLAGIDDSDSSSSRERHSHRSSSSRDKHASSGSGSASKWAEQMERSLSQSTGSRRGGGGSSSTMVSVVGYPGNGTTGSGSGSRASAPAAAGYDDYGGISSYSQISGIAGVASAMDDLTLNYGGYPRTGGSAAPAGGSGGTGGYGYGTPPPAAAAAYGGGSGGSSGTNGYGYGSTNAYGYGGSSSTSYPDGTSSSYGAYGASAGYQDPAAAGVNGYASAGYQQPAAAGGGYGSSPAADYGGGGGYYQQQQQPQQQQPAVSLIDQVPSQQPAYPSYYQAPSGQESAPPAAAPAAPPSSSWQVHHTSEGRPYYYNAATGTTQWEAPPGM